MATASRSAFAEEYTAAREDAALLELPERGVLEAAGPHRQKFLQGILTNEIQALSPGEGRPAALLDVKGHVQALFRVLVEKDAVLLETLADRLPAVERTFDHYKVAAPVRFRVSPTAVLGLLGPRAADALRAGGAEVPGTPPESHVRTSLYGVDVRVARASDLAAPGFAVHVAPDAGPALRNALRDAGVRAAGRDVLDALRIEAFRPWLGEDVTEDNLLHETGLVAEYCSFAKGCYLGQEVVARLDARGGNVSRALRRLRLDRPATRGAPVVVEGKEVGQVTTAAVSPRSGPIALAYVHRSHFSPGTAVEVAGSTGSIVESFDPRS
jgi:folate-binding protein YgfZ